MLLLGCKLMSTSCSVTPRCPHSHKLLTHFEAHAVSYQLFITSTLTSGTRSQRDNALHILDVLMGHVMQLCIRILVYKQWNKLMYNTLISHHKNGYSVQWLELEGPEPHVAN